LESLREKENDDERKKKSKLEMEEKIEKYFRFAAFSTLFIDLYFFIELN
jgi:hypothetical protein